MSQVPLCARGASAAQQLLLRPILGRRMQVAPFAAAAAAANGKAAPDAPQKGGKKGGKKDKDEEGRWSRD